MIRLPNQAVLLSRRVEPGCVSQQFPLQPPSFLPRRLPEHAGPPLVRVRHSRCLGKSQTPLHACLKHNSMQLFCVSGGVHLARVAVHRVPWSSQLPTGVEGAQKVRAQLLLHHIHPMTSLMCLHRCKVFDLIHDIIVCTVQCSVQMGYHTPSCTDTVCDRVHILGCLKEAALTRPGLPPTWR